MARFGTPITVVNKRGGPWKVTLGPKGDGRCFYTCDVKGQKTNGTIEAHLYFSPNDGVEIYMVCVTNIDWKNNPPFRN
jgi:hypothetical protein